MARTKVWNGTAWVYADEALPRSQSAEDITYDPTAQHTAGSVGAELASLNGRVNEVSGKENASNKVTSVSEQSTDTQYPSAKCVFDLIGSVEALLSEL